MLGVSIYNFNTKYSGSTAFRQSSTVPKMSIHNQIGYHQSISLSHENHSKLLNWGFVSNKLFNVRYVANLAIPAPISSFPFCFKKKKVLFLCLIRTIYCEGWFGFTRKSWFSNISYWIPELWKWNSG